MPSKSSRRKPANGIVAKLRARSSHDKIASNELNRFQAEPDIYQPVIEARLVKKLTAEPNKQQEFETLVTGMGPQVEMFQKIVKANKVTGPGSTNWYGTAP